MKKNILTSAITLAICGITTLAIAEESTTLPPITVTADYNTGVADMVTVTDKAIEDTAVTSPRNLVRNIPGVELENRATEGFAGFRIRGMGGSGTTLGTGQDRVAVDVDGVPLPNTFKRGHSMRAGLAPFSTDDLKAVEIIRGPETSMSGKSGLVRYNLR